MKTIIAGTDFTPSSLNACRYAAFLAQKLKCRLTIFNMFEAPIIHSNVGLYGISYSSARKNSLEKTNKVLDSLREEFSGLKVNMFVTNGNLKNELEDFTASHRVEAAVMGLEAKSRISKFIYGSHGVDIAGKINAPVFIVPQQFRKHSLSQIALAVDNTQKLNRRSLRGFEKFLRKAGIALRLFHVRTENEFIMPVVDAIRINGIMYPIEVINASDLQAGVSRYCRKHKIDLVAILSKKHSAVYSFFVETNTKKIAFVAKVPVMSIHE